MSQLEEVERTSPVFVGGLGGSGTRVVAALLQELHYHIGEDLNGALDNLWFTSLFKRHAAWSMGQEEISLLYNVFRMASTGDADSSIPNRAELERIMLEPRRQHPVPWLRRRAESLLDRLATPHYRSIWAWKEPNSHIVADRLLELDRKLRYIHIARNGIYMAHSRNQNQLRFWGDLVFSDVEWQVDPSFSLRYWCRVEKGAAQLRERYPNRVLWLRFEDLCRVSQPVIDSIADILGLTVLDVGAALNRVVRSTRSTDIRDSRDRCSAFRAEDVKFVESLGFPV